MPYFTQYSYAEYAASERSKCKWCAGVIAKGELRVGARSGLMGGYNAHLCCFKPQPHKNAVKAKRIQGYDVISAEHREYVKRVPTGTLLGCLELRGKLMQRVAPPPLPPMDDAEMAAAIAATGKKRKAAPAAPSGKGAQKKTAVVAAAAPKAKREASAGAGKLQRKAQ